MNGEVIEFIRWASNLSVVIPLVFYLRSWRASPSQHHIIGLLILLSGGFDLIALFVYSPIVSNIFDVVQFSMITWFYYKLVYKKRAELVALIGIGVYLAALIYSVSQLGASAIYSAVGIAGSLIVIIHSITYGFSVPGMVIERYYDANLLSNMLFNIAIFIYFLVALTISCLFDTVAVTQDLNSFKAFWTIHNVFNILKNLVFALGFYYTGKRQIYMTLEQLEKIARQLEYEENDPASR